MDCFINYKNKIYKEEDFKEFIQEQLNSINNSGLNIKWNTNQTLEEKIKVIDFFNMENFFHTTASEKKGDLKQGLDNFIHLGTEKTAQEIFEKKTNFKGEIHKVPNRFKNTNIIVLNNLESNYDPFESDSTSTVQQILRLRYREPKATEIIKEFNKAENKKEWVAQEFNNITFVYFNKIEGFNEVSIAVTDSLESSKESIKDVENTFTIKINQFNYTLNTSTGEVVHNTKTKGNVVETNPLQINKVYIEYAKNINNVIKEFNDSQYIKIFNKVINIKNANEVTQKQILDLFENKTSIQVNNEEYIDKKFEVKSKSKSSITYENLNNGQKQAYNEIVEFLNDPNRKTHSLIGYAGTGKTTILNFALKEAPDKVIFATPTHKANNVLKQKNPKATIKTIQTILGLQPNFDLEKFDARTLEFEQQKYPQIPSILVIDEASMINDNLYESLIEILVKKNGTKILFVGDDAQLQPVKQDTKSKALTLTEKTSSLTEVMRADNDSLLEESMVTRETGKFTYETNLTPEGKGVEYTSNKTEFFNEAIKAFKSNEFEKNKNHIRILSATNEGVDQANSIVRKALYGENPPELIEGELLMAYNNAVDREVINSEDYIITSIKPSTKRIGGIEFNGYELEIKGVNGVQAPIHTFTISANNPDENFIALAEEIEQARLLGQVSKNWGEFYALINSFTTLRDVSTRDGVVKAKATFKHGYVHTIHKSQGGTYKNIFILDDTINTFPEEKVKSQLRYVGITRAESKATIYSPNKVRLTKGSEDLQKEINEVKKLTYKSYNPNDREYKMGSVVKFNGQVDLILDTGEYSLEDTNYITLLNAGRVAFSFTEELKKNVQGSFPVINYQGIKYIVGAKEVYKSYTGEIIKGDIRKEVLYLSQKDIAKQNLKNQFEKYEFAQIHKDNKADKPLIEAAKEIVANKFGYWDVAQFEKETGETFNINKYFLREEKGDTVIIRISDAEPDIKRPPIDYLSRFTSGSNPLEAKPNISNFYNDTKIFEC